VSITVCLWANAIDQFKAGSHLWESRDPERVSKYVGSSPNISNRGKSVKNESTLIMEDPHGFFS
jgi:hypothetical protein